MSEGPLPMVTQKKRRKRVGIEQTELDKAADAAKAQAIAKGLTLQRSNNTTGYKGVADLTKRAGQGSRFVATVYRPEASNRQDGRVLLGCFSTPEEAALAYAKTPEAQAQVAKACAAHGRGGEGAGGSRRART